MHYILAMDQGTTSSRAIVFDDDVRIHAIAQQEYRQLYPQPGWVEHDPHNIWQSQLAVAQQALVKAGITARDVTAIGITNQRETTLLWDRHTGEPIGNAIVWQDRRTADFCAQLKSQYGQLFRERTGQGAVLLARDLFGHHQYHGQARHRARQARSRSAAICVPASRHRARTPGRRRR